MYDVIVVGGGFAGVTAAREAALRGSRVLLLEARDRLGGRTWTAEWRGAPDRVRRGLGALAPAAHVVGDQPRRAGGGAQRGRRARRLVRRRSSAGRAPSLSATRSPAAAGTASSTAWSEALPQPSRSAAPPRAPDPVRPPDDRRADGRDRARRRGARRALHAELESLAHGRLDDAGAVSVLRWHALSGYSLALTQYTGGRVTLADGTVSLLQAIAGGAQFETRLETPVEAVEQNGGARRGRDARRRAARRARGRRGRPAQRPRPGIDVRARAVRSEAARRSPSARPRAGSRSSSDATRRGDLPERDPARTPVRLPRHRDHGRRRHAGDDRLRARRRALRRDRPRRRAGRDLDRILPGYEVVDASAHDWLADEFSRGTWAIHRPGWYEHHHAEMRRPEGRVLLAGSDLANGWAGFIDGAIESGLRSGVLAHRMAAAGVPV